MKIRTVPIAASLGSALFWIVACSGATFEAADNSAGAASGATDTGGSGGKASGGSASGGTTKGGSASGGSSSAGATSAGSTSGGASSGGASSGGGGASSGGAPAACNEDTDCVPCAFPTAPEETADCYCAGCASTISSKTTCAANKAAWEASCADTPILCPAIACIRPPTPACKSHECVAK